MNNQRKTVLLFDDDEKLLQALTTRLQFEFDVETLTACNALTAIAMLPRQPDLVICDVKMPTANGLDILDMMEQDGRFRDIQSIVLSGCSDGDTWRRVAALSTYFIHKGGDIWGHLRPVIEELLDIQPVCENTMAMATGFDDGRTHT